jgi:hypothetical protein
MHNHIGTETKDKLNIWVSSEESWTMGVSLIQQYFMGGSRLSREPLSINKIMTKLLKN